MAVEWDDRDFQKKFGDFNQLVLKRRKKAVNDVASEVLRLANFEVPHDLGTLQNSGHVEEQGDEALVGYNTVYAARLHEHPEYRFQKGRKAKYLEDPIKNNLHKFIKYMQDIFKK